MSTGRISTGRTSSPPSPTTSSAAGDLAASKTRDYRPVGSLSADKPWAAYPDRRPRRAAAAWRIVARRRVVGGGAGRHRSAGRRGVRPAASGCAAGRPGADAGGGLARWHPFGGGHRTARGAVFLLCPFV